MGNQRTTFLKRQREADRNDKQKAKEQRLAQARSGEKATSKGPQIAWDEAVTETDSALTSDKPPATGGNLSSPNANSNNSAAPPPGASRPPIVSAANKPGPAATKPSPAPAKPATTAAPAKPPVKP
jgi:hypothetical protein